jgi:TIR domain
MGDIFISYSSEDRARAQKLVKTLDDGAWSIFWDRTIPAGKSWREIIGKELDDARCVIVLWSKSSIESSWVLDEADDARRRGVLVPILIDNVLPPIGFRSIQAVKLVDWDSEERSQTFDRLVTDIRTLIGAPPLARKENKQAELRVERAAEARHWSAKLAKKRWSFTIELRAMEEDHRIRYVPGFFYGEILLDDKALKSFWDAGTHKLTFTIPPHLSRFFLTYDFGATGISRIQFFVDDKLILDDD